MVEALIYDENIKYQVVKLAKEMHTRALDGKETLSLKRAHGLIALEDPVNSNPSAEEADKAEFEESSILARYRAESSKSIRCDFLILVTMYNEGIKEFSDTLSGIIDNMESFLTAGIDLKHIVCIVIVDGMKAFKKTYSDFKLFFQNYFNDQDIKEKFKVEDLLNCKLKGETEHDEFAHCFEQKLKYQNNPKVFLNFIFCVKQKNKRKLNSHLWFFGGFCPHFHPTYIMLIDVGTVPNYESLFLLYEAMATDSRIGGCTGEIKPLQRTIFDGLIGYQVVEYKLNGIFERTFESVTGLITYLPSTFSAYRWDAVQGEPLWSNYFLSVLYPEKLNLVNANIYLTGDRLLSYSVFTKKQSEYLFRFVKGAAAETDVPEDFPTLMIQRRRWINGTFFGIYHLFKNYSTLIRTNHHWFRKVIFTFQLSYILLSVINNWIIVASLYLFISISIRTLLGLNRSLAYDPGNIVMQFYMFLLVIIVIMSYGTKPDRIKTYMKWIYFTFSVFIFSSIFTTLVTMNLTSYPSWVLYAFIAVLVCFVIGSTFHLSIATLIKYMFHYISAYPTFINVLNIYAVVNIHEVTWGSRPDLPTPDERKRSDEYEHHRTRWVILWVVSNVGYYALVMGTSKDTGMYYLYVTMAIITIIYTVKFVGSIIYLFQEWCCRKKLSKVQNLDKIINNRSQAIKLQKKNKRMLEKSFTVRSQKSKVQPSSVMVPTECDSNEKKIENTIKVDDVKVSSATILPLENFTNKDSDAALGKIPEKKIVEKKKEKKKDKKKKEKKGKKNKKDKKKKKVSFKLFGPEDVNDVIEENDVNEEVIEEEKVQNDNSGIMDFGSPVIIPIKVENWEESFKSDFALDKETVPVRIDSAIPDNPKSDSESFSKASSDSEKEDLIPIPVLSNRSPPGEFKILEKNLSSRATPLFPVEINPSSRRTSSKDLKSHKNQNLFESPSTPDLNLSPIKKSSPTFSPEPELKNFEKNRPKEIITKEEKKIEIFEPIEEKVKKVEKFEIDSKKIFNQKSKIFDTIEKGVIPIKPQIGPLTKMVYDDLFDSPNPKKDFDISPIGIRDLTPKDESQFSMRDKSNTIKQDMSSSKFEYNQKEDLSEFSSRLNKPETSFKPKQIDYIRDSKSFKNIKGGNEAEDDLFKNEDLSSFNANGKGFDHFLDEMKDDNSSFKDFSIGLKSELSGFNPTKAIYKNSSKATEKSGYDVLNPKQDKDLFEPGVLADERYRLSIPIKRLSTITGIMIKRIREIEDGKAPEIDEAEKIRNAMKEFK